MKKWDVIVIGGGIIGGWSAMELQKRGLNVALIERDYMGAGASSGNCGYICPSHVLPLHGPGVIATTIKHWIRREGALSIPPRWDPKLWSWLYRFSRNCNSAAQSSAAVARHALLASSRAIYEEFSRAHGHDFGWQHKGLLLVFSKQQSFDEHAKVARRLQEEFGLKIERFVGDEVCRKEPTLREGLAGGWFYPNDAHVSPIDLVETVRAQFEQAGGEVISGTSIQSMQVQSNRVAAIMSESGQRFEADQFVLATGAEAPHLAEQLGVRLSIVPGKGFSFTIAKPSAQPQVPMIFEDTHVAVTPFAEQLRIGSTMQFTGYDRSIPAKRLELLWSSAQSHLRDFKRVEPSQTWCGWRPMSSDGMPFIGRTDPINNVVVAAGNGMIGIASASGTGRLVADLIARCQPHIDPTPYRLNRSLW
jgi:D-amino-acid dehydrogenase